MILVVVVLYHQTILLHSNLLGSQDTMRMLSMRIAGFEPNGAHNLLSMSMEQYQTHLADMENIQ